MYSVYMFINFLSKDLGNLNFFYEKHKFFVVHLLFLMKQITEIVSMVMQPVHKNIQIASSL